MSKILATILTHEGYSSLFERVWDNLQKIKVPNGFEVDYLVVFDGTSVPQHIRDFVSANNIDFREITADMSGFKVKDKTYVSGVTGWNEETIYRVAQVRNAYLKIARDGNYDWLLNIDGDSLPPSDTLEKLLSADKKCISGWSYSHKMGIVPIVPNKIESGEIHECLVTGKWAFLEHRDVFGGIDYLLYEDRVNANEDERRHFDIREAGHKIYIHPGVYCEHLLESGVVFEPELEKKIEIKTKEEYLDKYKSKYSNKHEVVPKKIGKKLILNKWENTDFSVELIGDYDYKQYELDPEVVGFENWYEPYVICQDGGFEFEVTLNEKPDTNIFGFKVDTTNYDFFYQPFLSEESRSPGEILFKPPEVEGSYAVFHKVKKGNQYQTGKFCHIYRPKIYDANGDWVWGELKLENDVLKIIVPQDFLDNGIYPLRVDPTFGYTSVGGSSVLVNYTLFGSLFTGVAGTGVSMSVYLANTDADTLCKCAIYNHTGSSYLANSVTAEKSGVISASWQTFNFVSSPTLTATSYVLTIAGNSDFYNYTTGYYDTGDTDQGHQVFSLTYTAFPQSTQTFSHNTRKYSIYVTYDAVKTCTADAVIIETVKTHTADAYIGEDLYWVGGGGVWSGPEHWARESSGETVAIDYYYDTSGGGVYAIDSTAWDEIGQSFTGDGRTVVQVRTRLRKYGSPTGSAYIKIYAHSGTYGSTSIGTGSALATSDAFDVSTLTTSYAYVTFTFSGVNQITLTDGTYYVLAVSYGGGSGTNSVWVPTDNTSPTHGGNLVRRDSSVWSYVATDDLAFYVQSAAFSVPTAFSNVYIDSSSGFGSGGTITLDGSYHSCKCHDLTANSGHTFSIAYSTSDLATYGSVNLESGLSFASNTWLYFASDNAETITSNGCQFASLLFGYTNTYAPTGSWTLQDDLTSVASDYSLGFYCGTFDANGYDLTGNGFYFYGSSSCNPTVYMGSGTWEANGDGGIWYEYWTTGGDITIYCETSTLKISDSTSNSKYLYCYDGSPNDLYDVWFTGSGTGAFLIYDTWTFHNLTIDTPPHTLYLLYGITVTLNDLIANGTSGNPITITSDTFTTDYFALGTSDGTYNLYSGSTTAAGQSLYCGADGQVVRALVYLKKTGSPTGNATLSIYAHSGTFGTSSVPTGSALATSDAVDVSGLTTVGTATLFTFSGTNSIDLESGTYYVLVLSYSGGDASNYVQVLYDGSSPTDSGNASYYNGTWTAASGVDIFYTVYSTRQHYFSKSSGEIRCDYLNLSHSNATGGATWYAGVNSVDTLHNDGWIFGYLVETKTNTADALIFENFHEDFESGTKGDFDSETETGGASISIDGTSKIAGTYSAKISVTSSGNAYYEETLVGTHTEFYAQFRVYYPSGWSQQTSTYHAVFAFMDASNNAVVWFNAEGSERGLTYNGDMGWTDTGIDIGDGVHDIKIYVKVSATVGQVRVWIDNFNESSPNYSSGNINTGTDSIAKLKLGGWMDNALDSFYFDNIYAQQNFLDGISVLTKTHTIDGTIVSYELVDQTHTTGTVGAGWGDAERYYASQSFLPVLDTLTAISFQFTSVPSYDVTVYLDTADSNHEPIHTLKTGALYSYTIPHASLDDTLTKYSLPVPQNIAPNVLHVFYLEFTNGGAHASDYRDMSSSNTNGYTRGRRLHYDSTTPDWTAPDSGNLDMNFQTYGYSQRRYTADAVITGAESVVVTNTADAIIKVTRELSINRIVSEDMTDTPSGTFLESATWISGTPTGYVRLTEASDSEAGQLQYVESSPTRFTVNFKLWVGGGTGADAVWFYWGFSYTPSWMTEESPDGYIVAFDEYIYDDAGGNTIQLWFNGTRLDYEATGLDLDDSTWRDARIEVDGTNIKVFLDETLYIDYTDIQRSLPGSTLGWGARTGGMNDEHRVAFLYVDQRFTADAVVSAREVQTIAVDAIIDVNLDTLVKTNTVDGIIKESLVSSHTADGLIQVKGTKTCTVDGSILATTVAGGYGAKFDGENDYIQVADNDVFSVPTTGGITVSFWMRPDVLNFPVSTSSSDGEYVHFLGKGEYGSPNQEEWLFRIYNFDSTRPNRVSFYVFNSVGGTGVGSYFQGGISGTPNMVAGEWIHVVGKIDATSTYIYRNGALKDSDVYTATITPANTTAPLRFGHVENSSDQGFFKGMINDIKIWNRALSGPEVLDVYSGVPVVSGLIASYTFDDQASTATDSVGGYSGTIYGALYQGIYSADAIIQEQGSTETQTADGIIKETFTKSQNIDAVIRETFVKTVTVDTVIQQAPTKTITADAVIKEILYKAQMTDAIVLETTIKTYVVSGAIRETFVKSYLSDGIMRETFIQINTADGVILVEGFRTVVSDGIVLATTTKSFGVSAVIQTATVCSYTADAIVFATDTREMTISALIKEILDKTHTTDGVVKEINIAINTAGGSVREDLIKTLSADGIIQQRNLSVTNTADAVIKEILDKTITVDGAVLETLMQSNTIDAVIEVVGEKALSADGIMFETIVTSRTCDAHIVNVVTTTSTVDAVVMAVTVKTYTVNGIIAPDNFSNSPFYLYIGNDLSIRLGSSRISTWTNAGRPDGIEGTFGYNLDSEMLEVHDGSTWQEISGSGSTGISVDTLRYAFMLGR